MWLPPRSRHNLEPPQVIAPCGVPVTITIFPKFSISTRAILTPAAIATLPTSTRSAFLGSPFLPPARYRRSQSRSRPSWQPQASSMGAAIPSRRRPSTRCAAPERPAGLEKPERVACVLRCSLKMSDHCFSGSPMTKLSSDQAGLPRLLYATKIPQYVSPPIPPFN
jgi:hypothetical protein